MLTYDLSQRGNHSIYEYLYLCIRDDILRGVLAPNEKLPSKRTMASHHHIGVITVENAYAQLIQEGYIYSQKTQGYFVCPAKDSPFLKKEDLSDPEEQPERDYLIDFKSNKCSQAQFPSNIWIKLMRAVLTDRNPSNFQTVPFNGLYVLRKAIADHLYKYRGMEVLPSQIIIGAGTEYLYSRLLQVFGSNNIIAYEDPGYKKLSEISSQQNTLADYIPVDDSGLSYHLLCQSKANIIHVSPANHFPTGIVMSRERCQELLRWVDELPSRYVIEDDYDSELRFSGPMLPTLYSQNRTQKVIYMNTFSKSIVPSIRIAYMVLPQKLMERYSETLSFYSCTVSSIEQNTLAKFISEGYFERHINRLKKYYQAQRANVMEALKASPLSLISSIAENRVGTHFILTVNTSLRNSDILQAAEDRGMHLSFLADYCKNPGISANGKIVINYAGISTEQIPVAVKILESIFANDLRHAEKNPSVPAAEFCSELSGS